MSQYGLFVRHTPESEWVWEGFYPTEEQAKISFNIVELEHPEAEGIWVDPTVVLNSLYEVEEW